MQEKIIIIFGDNSAEQKLEPMLKLFNLPENFTCLLALKKLEK
jgi:hypothetical protein